MNMSATQLAEKIADRLFARFAAAVGVDSAQASEDDSCELMNTEQAANYLGLAPSTLETWRSRKRHNLAFAKVGRAIRYRKSDLDRFVASRTK